jgi:trypsin
MKSQVQSIAILIASSLSSIASAALFKAEGTVDADSLSGLRGNPSTNKKPIATQSSQQVGDEDAGSTRIIGGYEATPNEHSYAVSLQDGNGHFCGGSLITKNVVLTAAHCKGGPYNVVLGRHDLDTNQGQIIGMKKEIPHNQYDDWTTDNDFMLVVLKSNARLNSDVSLVALNDDSSLPSVGDEMTVMGWGDTHISDGITNMADRLMKVEVDVISKNECQNSSDGRDSYEDQITRNMLCARAHRQDSCQGDSGGPLVDTSGNVDKQVGVVSWGIGCASDSFPGVYARVSRAYNWIEGHVCAENREYATQAGFSC